MLFDRRRVTLKSRSQIERMAVAGRLVGDALDAVGQAIRPGITPLELDAIAADVIRSRGGMPVLHRRARAARALRPHRLRLHRRRGRPWGPRRPRRSATASSSPSTAAPSWMAGMATARAPGWWARSPQAARRLSAATREAMLAGVAASVPGHTLEDVAGAIEDVGLAHGYGIVRAYVGHGIGNEMHEEPQVTNYRTGRSRPPHRARPLHRHRAHVHAGRPRDAGQGRRLDGRHRGRQPGGPLGAHHRHHRGRAAHPDARRGTRSWLVGAVAVEVVA